MEELQPLLVSALQKLLSNADACCAELTAAKACPPCPQQQNPCVCTCHQSFAGCVLQYCGSTSSAGCFVCGKGMQLP